MSTLINLLAQRHANDVFVPVRNVQKNLGLLGLEQEDEDA